MRKVVGMVACRTGRARGTKGGWAVAGLAVLIASFAVDGDWAAARADATTAQGVFSKDQSKRGEDTYMKNCAQCHQPDLGGRAPVPELAGDTFMSHWTNHSVADLFKRITTTMPQGRPGSLSKDAYADVIAFLLDSNGFPSGNAELKPDPDALQKVKITAQN